ncbi:MAG: S41 family peptidase [Chitinophagaceae bacterium]|nr:S41 family peptidase [Chitinophagaceae bacterium]
MIRFCFLLLLSSTFYSCAVSNKNYNPDKKISRQDLQADYNLLRNILEKKHPSLYWYTPKDSMNFYFDSLYRAIPDSMTELQFGWNILAPLTQKIHCGHTSFGMSRHWGKYIQGRTIPSFPLFIKVWRDTMVITGNLNKKDTVLKPGMLITSINNMRNHEVIRKMFQYLPLDGYADNVNYIRISGNFPYFHRNVFGLYKNYQVGYIDSSGNEKTVIVPMWAPQQDTGKKKAIKPLLKTSKKQLKKERIENARSLTIDSISNTATLTLNTFSNGGGRHLRSFIKRSFKTIKEQQVKNLIIDLRSNGGGDITLCVLLTKYLRNTPFKVADSAYSIAKNFSPFTGRIKNGFFSNIGLLLLTKKRKDGFYHFGYWERHLYKPKTRDHFDGKTYVLINGPTFSASTLFCNLVKGQEKIKLVGEEAGGGWHGNNGIMIPDIRLPNTKIRMRLPFFRLVQYNHVPKDGSGVLPDIYIPPTIEGVRKGIDRKMLTVKEMIKQDMQ